jgi:hypothetical protein
MVGKKDGNGSKGKESREEYSKLLVFTPLLCMAW